MRVACPDFPAGRYPLPRRARASHRFFRRPAGSPARSISMPRLRRSATAVCRTVSVFESEKVELHQPGLLDPFHVELGHRHQRFRITIERHHLGQRPFTDHNAGSVSRGVSVQAFEPLRDVEGSPTTGSLSRAACRRGSSSTARNSVTGLGDSAARACTACRLGRTASAARARRRAARHAPAAFQM